MKVGPSACAGERLQRDGSLMRRYPSGPLTFMFGPTPHISTTTYTGFSVSLSAPATSDGHASVLAYLDVVILVVAAPIMLLIGVPAAGTWSARAPIVLRAVGVAIERHPIAARSSGRGHAAAGVPSRRLFTLAMR